VTLGHGRLGQTEARLLLIAVNTPLALGVATFGLLECSASASRRAT